MALRRSLFTLGSHLTSKIRVHRPVLQSYVQTRKPLNFDSKTGFRQFSSLIYADDTQKVLYYPRKFDDFADHFGVWEEKYLCIVHPVITDMLVDMVRNIEYLEEDPDCTLCVKQIIYFEDLSDIVTDAAVASAGDPEDVRRTKVREALKGILKKVIDRIIKEGRPAKMFVFDQFIRVVENIEDPESLSNLLVIFKRLPFKGPMYR